MIDLDRTKDSDLLRQVAKIQDAELRRLQLQVLALKRENEALKGGAPEEIDARIQAFEKQLAEGYSQTRSRGSERRPKGDKPEKDKKPQTGHGPTPQPDLPVDDCVHDLDDADKACPSCGEALLSFEGQDVASEEIDVIGVKYFVKRHLRRKYRCRCGCAVETALPPARLIPGGRYSTGFAVHVASEKFGNHMPLERQVRRMRRAGLQVTTQTLWDQTLALSYVFDEAMKRLHAYLLKKDLLLADESRWPLLGAKSRETKNWFAWTLVADDAILHKNQSSRSNEAAAALLTGFQGVLVTDGYVVYQSMAPEVGYVQAHCWAHARRKFIEAEASAPEEAALFLDDIGELFGIEREIADQLAGLDPDAANAIRAQIRSERSRAVANRLGRRAHETRVQPRSPIASALAYLENRSSGLTRFVDDPRVPLASNGAERALRGLVLGRNNHFGSRSQRGTEVAATFYSLIESAKLNSLDPEPIFGRPPRRTSVGSRCHYPTSSPEPGALGSPSPPTAHIPDSARAGKTVQGEYVRLK